jgi:hypothetical protein
MNALLVTPWGELAPHCDIGKHRPTPLRYVWHHVLPQAAGGQTNTSNLLSLCDTCHYAIHVILWHLRQHNGQPPALAGHPKHMAYAIQGYQLAVAAGTQNQIPNEGGLSLPTTAPTATPPPAKQHKANAKRVTSSKATAPPSPTPWGE